MTQCPSGIRCAAALAAVLAVSGLPSGAYGSTPSPHARACYRDLLNEYPLVVLATWDQPDFAQQTADEKVRTLTRIRLRVHDILKGKCSSVIEVSFKGRFSVRYGAEGGRPFGFGGWRADAGNPKRNTWAICASTRFFEPGLAVPVPVIRDVRSPALYFLGRKEVSGRHFDYEYVIRGEKWAPLPMALPGPYRPLASATAPAAASRPAGGEPALVISRTGEVQGAPMMHGWAALLGGKQPDVVFRAVQEYDRHSRSAALAELRGRADRGLWGQVLKMAVAEDAWAALDEARDEILGELVLARLKTDSSRHYSRLWGVAFSTVPGLALTAAKEALESPDTPPERKATVLWQLAVCSDPADGADQAVLIAGHLSDENEKIRRAALRQLVGMLVERGGSFPDGAHYQYLSPDPWCRRGALAKVTAALTESLGQEAFGGMLEKHPALAAAAQPRIARHKPVPRGHHAKNLAMFEGGKLPRGPQVGAWETLSFHKTRSFVLDIMVRALASEEIKDHHRRRCMVAMIEAAILCPARVKGALAKLPAASNSDILAVRCFLDPATDAAPLAAELIQQGGPRGQGRVQWYLRAIGSTTAAAELLAEVIRERRSEDLRCRAVEVMVSRFGRQATYESVCSVRKVQYAALNLCRPPGPPPGPSVQLQAVQVLESMTKSAGEQGALRVSSDEFGFCRDALAVLKASTSQQPSRAIYEFVVQRPYVLDLQAGSYRPARACRDALDVLMAKTSPLYFMALQSMMADPDWQWRRLARDHLGQLVGTSRFDAGEMLEELSAYPHLGAQRLRLELLARLGCKVGEPDSPEGIRALAEAVFGRPDEPLSSYSRGANDQAAAHLASWVIAETYGPVGVYAVAACGGIPQGERTKMLAGVLARLAKEGLPPAPRR